MKEAYCSYEISKLLKEKGFDECIFEFYVGDRIMYARNDEGFRLSELPDIYYPHITHQMACAWLREVHNIDICVFPYQVDCIGYSYEAKIYKDKKLYLSITDSKTYEDSVEIALKYTLNLII